MIHKLILTKDFVEEKILEAMKIDSKTLIKKSDNEDDLPGIIDFINQNDKNKKTGSLLDFASKNRVEITKYKFNRDDYHSR